MSYSDPMSITIDAGAISLPRVDGPTGGKSTYRGHDSNDIEYALSVSHQLGKRARRVIRLDVTNPVVEDLYLSNVKGPQGMSIYTVFDLPRYFSETNFAAGGVKAVWDGYDALLNASSDVAITKLLNGES